MKICKVALIFAFLFFSHRSQAVEFSTYIAASQNFGFPGSVRIGFDSWEYGLLSPRAIGAAKSFRGDWTYLSFGPALGISMEPAPGFFGAAGFFWHWVIGLGLRGEFYFVGTTSGMAAGEGTLGLWWRF